MAHFRPFHKPVSFLLIAALLPLLLTQSSCIRNPATRKVHTRLLSAEAEKKIGEQAKKDILQEYHVFKSTEVQTYVNRVGQRLAKVCDRPTVDYDFTILDNDLINAFAVPGGFIFVTRGLLENISDEDELAMVLGHEIGHVAALHGVQMIQKEMGQNALTILGTIGAAFVAGPEAMMMVANTASLFSALYLLGYSRDKELEADNLGLQYMLRAGYDPQAALSFLKKLGEDDDKNLKGWDLYFRTHPPIEERIKIIQSLIGVTAKPSTEQGNDYQRIKDLLPRVGASERGVIAGQLYTNRVFKLSLEVPSNWQMGFFHPQSLVSFHTVDRKAEGRLQVIELSSMTLTAETLALELAKNDGFRLMGGRNVLYTSGYGFLGRFLGVSPGGRGLDIRLYCTIRYGKGYVLMVGAPPEEQESYLLDMEQIVRSLRFTDS